MKMKTIGNIIWFIFGGLFGAFCYVIAGIVFCVTIIGIPVGKQCFKLAKLTLWPFGREVVHKGGAFSFIVNVIWVILAGLWLAIGYFVIGLVYCVTVIGIPFGKQAFKLAKLSLSPFGAEIVKK